MIVARVQCRVLFVYMYSKYKDQSSIDWIGTTDEPLGRHHPPGKSVILPSEIMSLP